MYGLIQAYCDTNYFVSIIFLLKHVAEMAPFCCCLFALSIIENFQCRCAHYPT